MNLIKTTGLSGLSTIINVINGFIITKIIAVYVGPSGIAIIGQFQNFIQVSTNLAIGSIKQGVIKYTAEHSDDENEKTKLWSTALRINLGIVLLFSILIVTFHNQFSKLIFGSNNYGFIFLIFSITLIFFALNGLFLAILNGQKEIKKLIAINITLSFVGLFLTGIFTYKFGLKGTLVSLVTGQSIIFFVIVGILIKSRWFHLKFLLQKIDKSYLKKLGGYIAMAFTSAFTIPVSLMIIRYYIGESISWQDAGYWDGVRRISTTYLMLIITPLSIYYLPRLSEIKENHDLRFEIINTYKIILPIVIIVAMSIYLLRDYAISFIFTEEFRPMRNLFSWQLTGDVLKIGSWILAYIMVAKAMTKMFIVTEILQSISLVLLSLLFINIYGLIGVTIAYAISNTIMLFVMIYLFRNILKIKFTKI
jgi:polysaccharide transporter, PST family